jgi:hypothetical protein
MAIPFLLYGCKNLDLNTAETTRSENAEIKLTDEKSKIKLFLEVQQIFNGGEERLQRENLCKKEVVAGLIEEPTGHTQLRAAQKKMSRMNQGSSRVTGSRLTGYSDAHFYY